MGYASHRLRLARTKQTSCKSMFFAARAPPSQQRAGARQGVVPASCDPRSPTQCLRCRYTSLADSLFSVFSLVQGRYGRASAAARGAVARNRRGSVSGAGGHSVSCGLRSGCFFSNNADVLFCSLVQGAVARLPACKKRCRSDGGDGAKRLAL